ncbi:Uncharacterised protein [Mycobacteroides abscessus]|nr:Uncharacterised protein [Mycobacteroides abscessus]
MRLRCTGRSASAMPYSETTSTVTPWFAASSSSGASVASSSAAAASACGDVGPNRCRS